MPLGSESQDHCHMRRPDKCGKAQVTTRCPLCSRVGAMSATTSAARNNSGRRNAPPRPAKRLAIALAQAPSVVQRLDGNHQETTQRQPGDDHFPQVLAGFSIAQRIRFRRLHDQLNCILPSAGWNPEHETYASPPWLAGSRKTARILSPNVLLRFEVVESVCNES